MQLVRVKLRIRFVLLTAIFAFLCSCVNVGECKLMPKKTDISTIQERQFTQNSYDDISSDMFMIDDVRISYPQFTDAEKTYINDLIKSAAISVFDDLYHGYEKELTLEIDYAITLKDEKMMSVVFFGVGNRMGSAHPNRVFYTVNINLKSAEKVYLKDIVKDIDKLRHIIENKNFTFKMYSDSETEEWFSVNELIHLEELERCDCSGSGLYAYLTENALGISFSVPYAIGNHHEFEIAYVDLDEILIEIQ